MNNQKYGTSTVRYRTGVTGIDDSFCSFKYQSLEENT